MQELDSHARTLEQNKKFHAMLRDIAKQVQWAGLWWDEEDWKRLVLGAAHGQHVVPNPLGEGLVVVNKKRSRELDIPSMMDLITQLEVFGAEKGVVWSQDNVEAK